MLCAWKVPKNIIFPRLYSEKNIRFGLTVKGRIHWPLNLATIKQVWVKSFFLKH